MAGETALARQLKKLAVPQTTVLIQDKIRKSFLFDHRDAAGYDREVIFAYGTTGLLNLCNINPLFSKFEADLFSLSYKDFQRSVQSASVNKKLDNKISEFLRMLSPYFLIRDAHDALEWLVYRFHIHLYNVDELIASALPHHNTSTFVRVVQLLDLDEKSRWFWLKSIQKTGVHLEYSAIINRFLTDAGFRKFVCDLSPNVLSVYKNHESVAVPIITFSMVTIYNALKKCKRVEDTLITSIFPYICSGLSSNLSKYTSASYMIIAKIFLSVTLNPKIVEDLLNRIFKTLKNDLTEEAYGVLLLAYQHQSVKSLPKQVHSVALSDSNCAKILFSLVNDFKAHSLIKAMVKKTVFMLFNVQTSTQTKSAKLFFKKFLNSVLLEEKCVLFTFNATIKRLSKCVRDKNNTKSNLKKLKKNARYVFKNLEHKYPDYFDKAFRKFLEGKSVSNKTMLSNLINRSVCSIKYEVVPNVKTSLAVGLNHANPQIRQTSVVYLLKLISRKEFTDKEFVKSSLYERLFDKNPNVILPIMSCSDIVLKIVGKSEMLSAIRNIVTRQIRLKSDWYAIQMKCLDIITKHYSQGENVFDVLDIILNFIFPANEHTVEGFLCLLNSNLENNFLLELKSLKPYCNKKEDITSEKYLQINCMVIKCLKKIINEMSEESRIVFTSFLNSKVTALKSDSLVVYYIYVMEFMLLTSKDNNNSLLFVNNLLQVFSSYFSHTSMTQEKFEVLSEECVVKKYVDSLSAKNFPSSLVYNTFYRIITKLELNIQLKCWPSVEDGYGNSYKILSNLFNFCVLYVNSDREFLREYFKTMLSSLISNQLKNAQVTFWFLSTKFFSDSESYLVQCTAAGIAVALCQNQMDWLFNDTVIVFNILKAVANQSPKLSHTVLNLLADCSKSAKKCTSPLKSLVDGVLMKSEEIKVDYRQCFDCIGSWLKEATENMNTNKSVTKSRVTKGLQNKISVLNEILNLLTEKDVPSSIKYFLMSCLQNADNTTILSSCIPVLYSHIELFKECKDNEDILRVIQLLIKKFTPKTAVCLTENSEESKALLYCLNCTIAKDTDMDRTIQVLTFDILSKTFFSAIPSMTVQQKILEDLLSIYMTSPVSINTKVEAVLRELCSYSYLFIKHIQDKELSASKSMTLREAKKTKIQENNSDSVNVFKNGAWKKTTVFLELMQGETNLLQTEILVRELFNLLQKSLDYDSQASVEYIKQLILSAIHSCCEQLSVSAQQELEKDFRVELIIHCIRSSNNPKTHHQALLLLNLAATMFPEYVLKNVMSIFVFMGSSLVRQDDSYSFQVISQTIETIVPSLLEASNQQTETDGYQVVASVIRVFVDSLLDIPGHRQLPLFTKLISTLNPSKYLWIPLGQICDQYATAFHDITTDDSKNWKVSPTLEFAVNLHKEFSPDIQIDTCINLVNFLLVLPDNKKQLESDPEKYKKIKEPFDIVSHSDKQLQIYKHNVLTYMKIWLTSQAFLSQVSELSVKQQTYLEDKYELLLGSVLGFLQDRLDIQKSNKDDLQLNNQIQLLYDLVHAVNSLLPCDLFIRVIRKLLKNKEEEIQARSVELLITKLEQRELVENHKSLLKLQKPLLKLVNTCLNEEVKDNKNVNIQQTALYALHLLCKLIGSEYPTKFYKVLNVSVAILSKYDTPELIVNALLCLAQLCHCLNVDILPHLNTFMPAILNILQDKKLVNMNECLILGIITALHSIVENLGIFLSSYMGDIIINICKYSVIYSVSGKKNILEKFTNLQTKLANEIPLRVLFTSVENSYSKLSKKNPEAIVPLMQILTQNLDSSKYEDILSSAAQLQQFYISSLDFRNCNEQLPLETVNLVENSIVSSLQTFVMKLSVTRFRTFFQKIYQWATVSTDDQEQKQRIFTFYKLTHEFSKSLKSLFSALSKYLFVHVSSILDSCNISKSKVCYFDSDVKLTHELLVNALNTLNYCFMYSEEQLLDKENFDLLMRPLVDQLENLDNETVYQELIENHLNSCIAHFMSSVSDSALWKALNYQILLKTRHDSPKVRFGTLQVLLEVVNKMGDNYLVLLPESIPFLAELMEDESSEVEKECQTVIIEMEKILGEPIRKYF